MNLHQLARGAVSSIARERLFLLYRSAGSHYSVEDESVVPQFEDPVEVMGQMQTLNPMQIVPSDKITISSVVRKVYLFSHEDPQTLNRGLGRTGDYLALDGDYWYITGILEDFSHEGWVCAQVVLQQGGDIPSALMEATDADNA